MLFRLFKYKYDRLVRLNEKILWIDNKRYPIKYSYVTKGLRTSEFIDTIEYKENIIKYLYDKLGNITHIYTNGELNKRYYYDNHNQLIKEKDFTKDTLTKYSYDNVGNIREKIVYTMSVGTLLKKDKYMYNNSNWEDQLSNYNNEEIQYDEIGNPISIGDAKTLTWMNGRELQSYSDTSKNLSVEYKYNNNGIRTEKKVNNFLTKYHLEGRKIIFEEDEERVIYYIR